MKLGDVVRLKSGSCPMTVTEVEVSPTWTRVSCTWFRREGGQPVSNWTGPECSKFPPEALELVEATQDGKP